MTQDQVFVPPTRSELGLPPFNPDKEDRLGSRVSAEVKKELWEALGDSPIGAVLGGASYLVGLIIIIKFARNSSSAFSLEDGLRISSKMLLVNADTQRAPVVSASCQCMESRH